MRPVRLLALPLLAGLVIGALVWLPVRLLEGLLPPALRCAQLVGSLWQGQCVGLSVRGSRSGELRWVVRMPQLADAALPIDVLWSSGSSRLEGRLAVTTDARARFDVIQARISLQEVRDALPADISLGALAGVAGELQTTDLTLQLTGGQLVGVRGEVRLLGTRLLRSAAELGDFAAEFRDTRGTVRDLGGPLQLRGEVQLDSGRYVVQARAEPRSTGMRQVLAIPTHVDIEVEGRL